MTPIEAISIYLLQENVPKQLVISGGNQVEMNKIGFVKQDNLWIISKKDAEKALENYISSLKPKGVDYEFYWKNEMKARIYGQR